ncbi:Uncharacterized conserved protein, contains Mth938-like domain [Devosia enhydra]|uniref:Uncharacterized conserved protein, contains Mth938-like domain n=1 Tax=Devosia enhydra TaxID=665118 RepID=A0A1K2HWE8_9HYPH|nr:MTH938/NDUFAF3 family protein [Devosia enhydra]SFZ82351.1 Uncharacterized conserved protein, contains Mth938-like domain [Devosia enhydra]
MEDLGHYPQQVPIEAYGNGGFRFAGMSHRGSLLCLPSGMYGWAPEAASGINVEALAPVLAEAGSIDVLLVGMGMDIAAFPKDLRAQLRELAVVVEPIATGGAVRTYNVLLAEQRSIAAALIAVPRVR